VALLDAAVTKALSLSLFCLRNPETGAVEVILFVSLFSRVCVR